MGAAIDDRELAPGHCLEGCLYVPLGLWARRGGQTHDRGAVAPAGATGREPLNRAPIVASESIAPACEAVGLVDGEQAERHTTGTSSHLMIIDAPRA